MWGKNKFTNVNIVFDYCLQGMEIKSLACGLK